MKADRMDDGRGRIEVVRPEHGKENNVSFFWCGQNWGSCRSIQVFKERIYAV
jgi:hypothetical protein